MKIYPSGTLISNRYEVVQGPHEKPSLLGGMGIVYLCRDRQEDRPVALKTFQPQFLPDRAARDRFLREGTTWVNLARHPHIVHCFGVDHVNHGQEVFLILEQIAADPAHSGASLRDWLQPGRPLPLATALLISLQIVRGLAHADHIQPGFVHRDLKPGNVLVGADILPGWGVNRVRVTDFGLVASLGQAVLPPDADPVGDLTRTQLTRGWVGTPLYMAPEQWQEAAVTSATDVYALGFILVEMVTGQRAVSANSLTSLKQAHLAGRLQPLPASLPELLAELIRRCLALDPSDRFQSWTEVETALAQVYQVVTEGAALPTAVVAASLNQAERIAQGWARNSLGLSYSDIGKPQVALGYFEQVQAQGEAEAEPALRAVGLGNLGNAYVQLGDARRAIRLFEQTLAIVRETGDRVGEGGALGNLGAAYRQLGDARRAIRLFEQTLAIVRETGDRVGEGTALGNLGIAYAQLGDARRAISFYEQHLAIAQETGNQVGEGAALGNLGNAYFQLGDARRAISYHEQRLAIAQETGDRVGEAAALGNLGTAYDQLGDAHRAISYHEQRLAIAQETGDRVGEGGALGNLGIAYFQLGDARRAISFYEQHLAIAQETGDRVGEGTALGNLGIAYAQLGDARRAISFYEQHLAIAQETGNQVGEGTALGNLGNAYSQLGDIRRAISFYEQSLAIKQETGDQLGEGNALGNLGIAYRQLGDARRAISFYEQSLAIKQETGDIFGAAITLFNLALLQVEQGDVSLALSHAQEAADIFVRVGHSENAQQAQQLVVQLQGGSAANSGPTPAQILENFATLISAVVAAAQGDTAARTQVETVFDQLSQQGWQIAGPIQRIWAGERDLNKLTTGTDPNNALIIQTILEQLNEVES